MKLLVLYLLFVFLPNKFNTNSYQEKEITLYDSSGKAIAYIATADDMTIYLWEGKPVAYLTSDGNEKFNIYGFNGKHLGWFIKGVLRNHDGDATGFIKGAFNINTDYEPYKGYKEYKPYKAYREYAPYMPYLSSSFSKTPLSLFLAQGLDN